MPHLLIHIYMKKSYRTHRLKEQKQLKKRDVSGNESCHMLMNESYRTHRWREQKQLKKRDVSGGWCGLKLSARLLVW